ncbi:MULTISPECIES: glycoside hydrolase family 172 protein [unclassified Parabacteroides]|nr:MULTISPECIES: glycoside hydrolase family 172 protein [unclassified Parabacteroides]
MQAQNKKGKAGLYSLSEEISLLKRVDLLPEYRTNCLVEQLSSYDTTGGNDDGFSGRYSYIRKENGHLVIADLKGPGVINRIWTPTPTNDTLAFYFDGEKRARLRVCFSDLFSGKVYPFVKPICGNEVGGFYCYIPIPYKKSCKIVFEGEKIMFHQIQYRDLQGYNVDSYTPEGYQQQEALLKDVCRIWSEIAPSVKHFAAGNSLGYKVEEKTFTLLPGQRIPFFEKANGGRIVGLEIDAGNSFEGLQKDVLLQGKWDHESVPAIQAPVADYFGYAFGKTAMRSLLVGKYKDINYSYMPLPFDEKAELALVYEKRSSAKQNPVQVHTKVYYNDTPRNKETEGKFYSVWRREIDPPEGKYYTFADLKGKGHYVGTVHLAQALQPGMTLFFEGDDSTYVDGKMRMHGTGSEDYYNGGWYALLDRWDRGISLPLHGSLDYSLPMARTGGYRFYLTDKMPYEKELYIGIEHGPEGNKYPVDYTSVAYYYSDTPLSEVMKTNDALRTVYIPKEHEYYPQLMDITVGGGVNVIHRRGIRLIASPSGMVRIMLNDVPEGKYKVHISYFEKENGADFCIWQRQKQLTDWNSTKASTEELKHKQYIGDIELTPQTNSLSFHIRKNRESDEFELDRIYLERIE